MTEAMPETLLGRVIDFNDLFDVTAKKFWLY